MRSARPGGNGWVSLLWLVVGLPALGCSSEGLEPSPSTSATGMTETRSCEMNDPLEPFRWCTEWEVPIDEPRPNAADACVTNTTTGELLRGVPSDGCPQDAIAGYCTIDGWSSNQEAIVYEDDITPVELEYLCEIGTFMPTPGHSFPEPTGCTMSLPAWYAGEPTEYRECQAYVFPAEGDSSMRLSIRSTGGQVNFFMNGTTTLPSGSYSSDTLPIDLSVYAYANYTAGEWGVNKNGFDPMDDEGTFSLTVTALTPFPSITNADRLKFHGTLDATFAPPTGTHPEIPFVIHVQAD